MPWSQLSFSCISVTSFIPLNGCNKYQHLSRHNTRSLNLRSAQEEWKKPGSMAGGSRSGGGPLCAFCLFCCCCCPFLPSQCCWQCAQMWFSIPLPGWLVPSYPPCLPPQWVHSSLTLLVLKCWEFGVTWEYIYLWHLDCREKSYWILWEITKLSFVATFVLR